MKTYFFDTLNQAMQLTDLVLVKRLRHTGLKTTIFILLVALVTTVYGETSWIKQDGRFATLETPATMSKDAHHLSVDSIQEYYMSPDLSLGFDTDTKSYPLRLQKELEGAVLVWIQQRNKDWAKSIDPEDENKEVFARIYCSFEPKDYPEGPFYLYLGFSAGDGNFSIHVRFRSLDRLGDIERMLKSIKLKVK